MAALVVLLRERVHEDELLSPIHLRLQLLERYVTRHLEFPFRDPLSRVYSERLALVLTTGRLPSHHLFWRLASLYSPAPRPLSRGCLRLSGFVSFSHPALQ